MRSSHTTQVPFNNAATITHNVNLSFEIGTSHFHATGQKQAINTNETDRSSARDSSDDQNGKSNDISHGENHENRSGYSCSSMNDQGNPNGIRPENDCVNGIQGNNSHEFSTAELAIRRPVKVNGKPDGISHELWKSVIVNPAPVLLIHPQVARICDPADINTTMKIKTMLEESYPRSCVFSTAIRASEKNSDIDNEDWQHSNPTIPRERCA